MSLPKAGPRTATMWALALGLAALGWAATGVIAAAPAATGLTLVAASDLTTHRFSVRTLGLVSVTVAAALIADAVVSHSWHHLVVAAVGTATASTLLLFTWLASAGVAFGDLLLGAFTVVVPFYLSLTAAAITVLVALVSAAAFVLARAAWSGRSHSELVPLAPALLVGWTCGVVVG